MIKKNKAAASIDKLMKSDALGELEDIIIFQNKHIRRKWRQMMT